MTHTIHSMRSLLKLMSTYWDIDLFWTRSKIKDEALWKTNCSYLVSYSWQYSEYVLGCNYGTVLYIPWIWVCQVFAYASVVYGCKYGLIMHYGRVLKMPDQHFARILNKPPVLNMPGFRIWQGYEYVSVTQCAKYTWICLNLP